MRKLYYTGGYVLVSDRASKALLTYARALAASSASDVVAVPAISEYSKPGYVHLLIGPASQLFSVPCDDQGPDPDDADIVADMERKTRELQPHRPSFATEMWAMEETEATTSSSFESYDSF
jgi:hypothetical protein